MLMKTLQLLFLSCVALATNSLAQTAGQFEIRKYNSGGGMTSFWITPENSKAFGLDGSGVPAMLTVGGATTLAGLSDVAFTGPIANLSLMQYDSALGDWKNIPGSTYLTTADAVSGYQPLNGTLGALSSLINAPGVLTNNGSGTFSYTDTAATGAGAADANKLLKLDAFGGAVLGSALTLKGDGSNSGTIYLFDPTNADFTTIRRNPASAGSGLLLTPEVTGGTLIGSNDVGTVTSTMLADPPPITNLYTANETWTNPSPATPRRMFVRLVAAGGGGGTGRKGAAGSGRAGGGGGGAGSVVEFYCLTTDLGGTESVTVGAGGTGAPARTTNSTDGQPGVAGGDTSFAATIAKGGNAGSGGGTTVGAAGAAITNGHSIGLAVLTTSAGGTGTATNGGPGTNVNQSVPTGGGGAGGISSSDSAGTGGSGGAMGVSAAQTLLAGGTGGTGGANGTHGNAGRGSGTGGGGGSSSLSANGGNGGNGGGFGSGGGGGAAGIDSVGDSGAGGNGAGGYALIITY